ncbi:MAG: hypothetical protein Q8W48_10905 [Candidatus Palauibacterales bacterium]|nr:hypothetical protein [Candidatus Palauibacterales bacterium]
MNDERIDPSREGTPGLEGAGESHPRGTLAIVGVYGLLFVLGWLFIYFFVFVPRGALTP